VDALSPRRVPPRRDFASLVDHLLAAHPDDEIEIVWNGDVLDFDAPWVKDGKSSFDEFPLTDEGCAEHTAASSPITPIWFRAAARLLLRGHRLLLLCGNHDIELYWPAVRRADPRRAAASSAPSRPSAPAPRPRRSGLEAQIRFRTWFHVSEDGIYLEHGSQYDHVQRRAPRHAPRHPAPGTGFTRRFGKLAFKRTGSRMGYFNPYYEETFYMGLFGYLGHFSSITGLRAPHLPRLVLGRGMRTAREIWKHRHSEDWRAEARALATPRRARATRPSRDPRPRRPAGRDTG
jgi:hypothetical protein